MNQSQLISHISTFNTPIKARQLRNELKEENFSLKELVDLTFYPGKDVAIKASGIIQFMMTRFPQNYLDDTGYMVDHIAEVTSTGCLKYYARVLGYITSAERPRELRNNLKEIELQPVVELCFKWLDDTKMLTAVRTSAAETLFNLRHRYPWIAEGLSRRLEAIVRTATPLLLSKANYILSFLHPED
jgi:hypothetical protein